MSEHKEIFRLSELLIKNRIPHTIRPMNGGWQIIYPSVYVWEGDAVEHPYSYGNKDDLIEVFGFGLKEPVGSLTAEEAFEFFTEAEKEKTNEQR